MGKLAIDEINYRKGNKNDTYLGIIYPFCDHPPSPEKCRRNTDSTLAPLTLTNLKNEKKAFVHIYLRIVVNKIKEILISKNSNTKWKT